MSNEMGECCYLCNECANSFATLDELEQHMALTHVDTQHKLNNNNVAVDEEMDGGADSPSSSDISMDQPLEMAMLDDGDNKFHCRFCPKTFEERSQLNVHYTHTHRDKPQYECEVCHMIFGVKRELSTHMRIHSGEQPHRCTQCGKEFGTRQLLKKHWMWHTGERSHVCQHCNKAFFQKGHLTQHLMIHAGGRPHQCHLCSKTFIFKFDLNRHMKIHAERGFSSKSQSRTSTPLSDIVKSERATPRPRQSSVTPQPALNIQGNESSSSSSTSTSLPRLPQQFYCIFCMKQFSTQAAFTLHLTYVHFRNGVLSTAPQIMDNNNDDNKLLTNSMSLSNSIFGTPVSAIKTVAEDINGHSSGDSATNSSCASSPHKPSPTGQSCGEKSCEECESGRTRLGQLEGLLRNKDIELERAREAIRRVNAVAATVLQSCNDFDKLWVLHTKKVYSQLQQVLCSIE